MAKVEPLSRAHLEFGRALRRARHQAEMSQAGLASEAGLHKDYIGGVERGTRNLTLGQMLKLSDALDVPLAALVNGIDGRELMTAASTSSARP